MPPSRILAGAMSGTSADGVDIALVQIDGAAPDLSARLLHHHAHPYPKALRDRIFALRGSSQASLADLAQLTRDITLQYAAALRAALAAAGIASADVTAIAAHGQTVYHAPPNTIQLLDPSLLAYETDVQVVSDFRRADCAAGGQGAPLVPYADYLLFRHPTKTRILLNIGGIANLTYLPANCTPEQVLAFDTGPGNCISDHYCRKFDHTGPGYDPGGERALRGKVLDTVIMRFLQDDFFRARPPRSTDGPHMIRLFESALERSTREVEPHVTPEKILATACAAASTAIVHALLFLPQNVDEVIVSGGGIHNRCLMKALETHFSIADIAHTSTDALNLPSQSKEALAFALLGAATLDGRPGNLPSVTGAARPVVLGSVTPRP